MDMTKGKALLCIDESILRSDGAQYKLEQTRTRSYDYHTQSWHSK